MLCAGLGCAIATRRGLPAVVCVRAKANDETESTQMHRHTDMTRDDRRRSIRISNVSKCTCLGGPPLNYRSRHYRDEFAEPQLPPPTTSSNTPPLREHSARSNVYPAL